MITMIAASSNAHKIKEIQSIMSKFGVKVVSRKEAGLPEFEFEQDLETSICTRRTFNNLCTA